VSLASMVAMDSRVSIAVELASVRTRILAAFFACRWRFLAARDLVFIGLSIVQGRPERNFLFS